MNTAGPATQHTDIFLQGGGEMGSLIRSIDWSATQLGPPGQWPPALKQMVSMMLTTKFPVLICWGSNYIQLYNDAFRPINGATKHPQAMGGSARDTYAEIWDTIAPMFGGVMQGQTFGFPDFMVPLERNGYPEDCYFDFSYSPIYQENGEVGGVLVICTETTEKMRSIQNLTRSEQKLEQMLIQLPAKVLFFRGAELIVETVNDALLAAWQRSRDEVLGKPLLEILPELAGQPFPAELRHVFETGETITRKEVIATLNVPGGGVKSFYNDYFYQPLTDREGKRIGVLATSFDVTDKVETRLKLEQSNAQLKQVYNELEVSEARFRSLVQGAPVAIGILLGRELLVESANNMMLKLWRKPKDVVGLPLALALPELEGQPFLEILDNVYTSGRTYHGYETKAFIEDNGKLQENYFTFIYEPLKDESGAAYGIIVVAIDVNEQVAARQDLQNAKDTLNLAIQAAELGTFDMDLEKGTLEWDDRCRTLFGISHHEQVSYDGDFVPGLHPDDRKRVVELIANEAMVQAVDDGKYDVEYRTIGAEDQKMRWVRAKGKVYFDDTGKPKRFIGAVLDITEQKQDEQRKNDFIGMVSHELKTPLTSLTAIVQVMNAKLKSSEDLFLANAAEKANAQVKKMANMINGFLNISRLESGKLVVHKQDFELWQLIDEIREETLLSSGTHDIRLFAGDPIHVEADRDKIGSVISNLLSNAIKYSPKGKSVEVHCQVTGKELVVSVKDEGMGIKPQDLKRLFDRFYRVESKHTAHIAGFGIGLYLSAEIIERHAGKIWAESTTGEGSTFYFSLPLKAVV